MDLAIKLQLREALPGWLAEDLGTGDLTTRLVISEGAQGQAEIVAKAPGVAAGILVVGEVYDYLGGVKFSPRLEEGSEVAPGDRMAELGGSLATILAGERLALNLLQRLSGIATLTRAYVREVAGTKAKILDTRKTTPGLRFLEKYAVRVGGGFNHRFGLYDRVLLKDNHLRAAGGVKPALALAGVAPYGQRVEIEVATLAELSEALASGAEWIMLDNMDLDAIKAAVELTSGQAKLEASGGMTLERVRAVAECGVDFISVGALTHSAPALDISLEVLS